MPDEVDRNGQERHTARECALARFAAEHDCVASVEELRELGFSDRELHLRVRQERLDLHARGIYRIGPAPLSQRGRFRAALLAGGDRSALFARSAAALHGVRPDGRATVDIVAPTQRRPRAGVIPHRIRLAPGDLTVIDGLAVTGLGRTYLDLGAVCPNHLRRAFIRGEQQFTFDLFELQDAIERAPLHRGRKPVERTLAEYHPLAHRTRSMAELAYLLAITKADLPQAEVNVRVGDFEIDFHWPALMLAVEIDGPHHDTAYQRAKDRARDEILRAHGWVVRRFRDGDVRDRRDFVVAETRRELAAARGRLAA